MSTGQAPRAPSGGRLARNLRLLAAFRALQMAMFPIAIVPLYWRDELGFTVAEIFLVHALFGLFTACLEFPGGYLADRIGYRTAMGVASGCSLLGWLALGSASGFTSVLAGEFLLACSLSLTSGTDAALLYESLVGLGRESEFARWFGRNRSLGAASEGTAALAAGMLYAVWPPLPFFVQALVWLVNAAIVLALVEPHRELAEAGSVAARVRAIFAFAAIQSKTLRASMAVTLVLGLSTFIPVWIFALYAEHAGVSAAWIGVLWAGANYTVAIGNWLGDRTAETFGEIGALTISLACIGLGLAGMGLIASVGGVFFYSALCLGRGLYSPVLGQIQQRLIPSSDRASLLSINSLLFRAVFFGLGPLVGAGIDAAGERRTLLVTGAVFVPLAAVSLVWLARVLTRDAGADGGPARNVRLSSR